MNVHTLGFQEHKQEIRKMLIHEGRDLKWMATTNAGMVNRWEIQTNIEMVANDRLITEKMASSDSRDHISGDANTLR